MIKPHGGSGRVAAAVLLPALILAGCAQPSRSLYGARDVGMIIETTEATVVTSRLVAIAGEPRGTGAVAGGLSAAVTTAALFGGGALATLAAVLGGAAGAGAGHLAEKELSSGDGIEYVLETVDGRTVTIVQTADEEPPIPDGSPVLMQMSGGYSRVIEHPAIDADAPEGGWLNPDAPGPERPPLPDARDLLVPPSERQQQ